MHIRISSRIFDMFPNFRRFVLVASNICNMGENEQLLNELRGAEEKIRRDPCYQTYRNIPRVSAWCTAFERLGTNPNLRPPSISGLLKRAKSGAHLPYINTLVTCFNLTSLEALVPCGGDDLAAVHGDLCLRVADGKERYRPLGKPNQVQTVDPGEIIYVDANSEVLCRNWCWRNSNTTKILPETTCAIINVDGLSPVTRTDIQTISQKLEDRIRLYCRAEVGTYFLSKESPEAEIKNAP
jgi:DNA/RNA-binding domain of Phe-tRNA-synthetase-like protein